MKILHFSLGCWPETLGTSRRLHQLLRGDGNVHYFVTPGAGRDESGEDWERRENFLVKRVAGDGHRVPEIPVVSRHVRASLDARKMARYLPEAVPDLVHAHTPLACALAGRRAARSLGVPLLYEIHTPYADEVGQRRRPGVPAGMYLLAKRLARAREAAVARSADTVVVQTGILGRRIAELFRLDENRLAVVPNGIDGRRFDPEPLASRREEIRRERGWVGKRIVLYSGYLDWINGVDFLLEAGDILGETSRKTAKIVLAGEGPLAEAAKRRCENDPGFYEYLGRVEARAMPELYAGADIFVIPRPDTAAGRTLIPIKLLEAMAMEKAVLASDLEAVREALGGNGYGRLFRPGDREDFRQRLEALIERTDESVALGRNARARVLAEYGWERSRKLLADVYRSLGGTDSPAKRTKPS